jgi:hypothetical protein
MIGIGYHPSFQQIACLNQETGEWVERRWNHNDGETEKFYPDLKEKGISERLHGELGIEVWIGNVAEIKAKRVRKK